MITKSTRRLHRVQKFYREVFCFDNLGMLLSLKLQLPTAQMGGVRTQFWHC